MEKNQAGQLIAVYGGRFPEYTLRDIYSNLENMDFSEASIRMAQTKDPIVVLLISIFLGQFGIDRFYIGDTTMGVLKLITCGGCGIWTIIDWFLIMGNTKNKNYNKINEIF